MNRAAQGKRAEALAEEYLVKKGLVLVQRNFRTKTGEIDLIMQDESTLIFVEVRYRKNNSFGGGTESVDRRKQAKLTRTAECYLAWHKKYDKIASRFDVVSISPHETQNSSAKSIEWIKNAF